MRNFDAILGSVVKAEIRESGLNVRTVSTLTGVPYSTLRRKIDGLSSFTVDELYVVAGILKVAPSEWLATVERKTREFVA